MYVGFRVSRGNSAQECQFVLGCVALVEQFPHRGGIEVLFWREAPARHFACSFPAGSASPQLDTWGPKQDCRRRGREAVSDGSLYRSMYAALFVALSRRTRVAASDGPSRSQRCPPPQDAIRPGGTKAAIRTRQSEDLLRVARPGRADRRHRARRRAYCSSTSTSVGGGGASPGRTR